MGVPHIVTCFCRDFCVCYRLDSQKTDSEIEFSVWDVYYGVPLGSTPAEEKKKEECEGQEVKL